MIIIHNRSDRLGSNFISKLCQIIYAHKNNIKTINENDYYNTSRTYVKLWNTNQNNLDSIFNKVFNFISENNNKNVLKNNQNNKINDFFKIDIKNYNSHVNLNKIQIDVILNIKQDIYTYFNQYLKYDFYNYLKNNIHYKLPNKKYICYHIRLGDIINRKKFNNNEENIIVNYYINFINNNNDFFNFNQKDIVNFFKKHNINYKKEMEYQSPVSEKKIIKNIQKIKNIYPEHELYLVTDSPQYLDDNLKKYHIIKNRNIDNDLWLMIHSDVLLTSKSSFSNIAALLHQGKKIYFEKWGLIGSSGLNSKYYKENIINYEFL